MKKLSMIFIISLAISVLQGQNPPAGHDRDIDNILPLRDRATVVNDWLGWRLDHIVPELMKRENLDVWIVMCREITEDPIYFTLVPEPSLSARRLAILVFRNLGGDRGVERYSMGFMGGGYTNGLTDRTKDPVENLAALIRQWDPKTIGIDVSTTHRAADGLTATLRERLEKTIGPEYSKRLVSAENVAVGWIESRSPGELSVYRHICGIAHDLIREFFSNGVIIPEVTTTEDLSWWICQRMEEVGVEPWFVPYITIQRHPDLEKRYQDHPGVIHRGDLLHCDIGIRYLRLCTDMQWHAYVLNEGETEAPAGLRKALDNAVQLAGIYTGEFKEGLNGYQIAANTMKKADAGGLQATLYSHPIGFFGHSAGISIDTRPVNAVPEEMPKVMEFPLHPNTCYAIEFGVKTAVPEWGGREVSIGYEETASFTDRGCRFIDGNQTALLLIK